MKNIMEELELLQKKANMYDRIANNAASLRTELSKVIGELQAIYTYLGGEKLDTPQPQVVYRTVKPDESKPHKRNKGIKSDVRANQVVDYVNQLGSVVKYADVKRALGIHSGGTSVRVREMLQKSKRIKIQKSGRDWYLIPRGTEAPSGADVHIKPKKQKKVHYMGSHKRSEYQQFLSDQIKKYLKLGHDYLAASRLAQLDWSKIKKGKTKSKDRFPEFESLNDIGNQLVLQMLENAMYNGTPLKFELDGRMLNIMTFDQWLEFAKEVLYRNDMLKYHLNVNDNRNWKLIRKQLHFC